MDHHLDTLFKSEASRAKKLLEKKTIESITSTASSFSNPAPASIIQQKRKRNELESSSRKEDDINPGSNLSHHTKKHKSDNPIKHSKSNFANVKKHDLKKTLNQEKLKDDDEKLKRTVFVGNVPVTVLEKHILKEFKQLFQEYGRIESIRFRSIAFSATTLPRKVAAITKKLHPGRDTCHAYIVYYHSPHFENQQQQSNNDNNNNNNPSSSSSSSSSSLTKSQQESLPPPPPTPSPVELAKQNLNTHLFHSKHLRVDSLLLNHAENHDRHHHDTKTTIFVGNLDFTISDETLYEAFSQHAGPVHAVRVVRDKITYIGKGFAYITFSDTCGFDLALKMNGIEIGGRPVRIMKCHKSKRVVDDDDNFNKNKKKKKKIHVFEGARSSKKKDGNSVGRLVYKKSKKMSMSNNNSGGGKRRKKSHSKGK